MRLALLMAVPVALACTVLVVAWALLCLVAVVAALVCRVSLAGMALIDGLLELDG